MAGSSVFTPGDLVISIYGNGDGSGPYTDNQASPIVLEDISTSGAVGGSLVLPQTASVSNNVSESPISGEYGSSSEGTLELSADGQSLTIAGYGVNAKAYNSAEASGGPNTYGSPALAQSTSIQGGQYTAVPRVVADVRYDGTIDTSTAVYDIDNTNNPRSAATVDGSSFYIAGQGVKGDTTQGLFLAQDGASSATPINTTTDQRTVEIVGGNLYVSTDSKQGNSTSGTKYTANISKYTGLPTNNSTAPTALPGLSQSVTLTAGQANGVNNSQIGKAVDISPENYFFANSTTLYVADGGQPKGGGLGDGGLQKWSFVNGAWNLDYTLSSGLNLVANTATSGTTGLIGLAGKVVGDTVDLYATNSTIGDTDQTYLYGIGDNLAATSLPANESFTTLATAAPDTNIRGVAFAPAAAACFASGTRIRVARGDVAIEHLEVGDLAVTSSGELRKIVWLGHRTVDCRGQVAPSDVLPIRIAAHAFAEGRPARDLLVSPGHAICVDVLGEVLIPAVALVNGATIRQVEVDAVTYWHVELESHDVVLAENLPSESYLDMGNRGFFAETRVVELAVGPDGDPAQRTHADFCRPFHAGGAIVEAVRMQLRRRAEAAGWTLTSDLELHLEVDGVRLDPVVRGQTARFLMPPGAKEVWLVSPAARPCDTLGLEDSRRLGLFVGGLRIEDGWSTSRGASIDDPIFRDGFHDVEAGCKRWTAGRARLPAELWEDREAAFFLLLDLAAPPVPRWQPARPRRLAEAV